ncbi:DUF2357 domain-containing protein [Chitinophaga lutea]|uniref:DUF2357 domain-containing protein n=1 Tax=Chitinophaga lutea TaxID=2488634 RepID=A0A3N4Q013_9BACT|nr:DUF2357 domain-containing protein [Chitinophaga lutea]RPE13456.1 DUF2357 domain-containing protein [Chitinophaga lutea]
MQKLRDIEVFVPISKTESVCVQIAAQSNVDCLWKISTAEAIEFGEAEIQVVEGLTYQYRVAEGYELFASAKVVRPFKFNISFGTISPGNYVGTLSIDVRQVGSSDVLGQLHLEVRSVKIDYRSDYRFMLEEIAEKCTELIMAHNAPILQRFEPKQNTSSKVAYQRFCFVKGIIDSEAFSNAVNKILVFPATKWGEEEAEVDARKLRRLNSRQLRQIANSPRGAVLKINALKKAESLDTPENRFIKYALEQFADVCTVFYDAIEDNPRHVAEVRRVEERIRLYLSHNVFKDVGRLHSLPLQSPVLQRKSGYREILRAWIFFDLAAQLSWEGGDDVYEGGKKDVAALYEYWLFFKLVDVIGENFLLKESNLLGLIEHTKDGMGLKLKQGRLLAVEGVFEAPSRKLNVQFCYNRTFSKGSTYPNKGSWTTALRPDYTLSIWPFGLNSDEAERQELIVHLHFDAKYRIAHLKHFDDEVVADSEMGIVNSTKYRTVDLLKMHTYRDAIRRTAGAYVLYPGEESDNLRGFHEILPGLGAFAIRPTRSNTGIFTFKQFLREVVKHFLNRASQRERMSAYVFKTYQASDVPNMNIALPEALGKNRDLLLDETTVLVGYCKNEQHLEWILSASLYNTRWNAEMESINLNSRLTGARYLLLHNKKNSLQSRLLKLSAAGPRILSRKDLISRGYPGRPTQAYYLVFEIDPALEPEFKNYQWDVTQLEGYRKGRDFALPFATDLLELFVRAKIVNEE